MPELTRLSQVVEFAYELNRGVQEEGTERLRRLGRDRVESARGAVDRLGGDESDYVEKDIRFEAGMRERYRRFLAERYGITEREVRTLMDIELRRMRMMTDIGTDYLARRSDMEVGFGVSRKDLMDSRVDTLNASAEKMDVIEAEMRPKAEKRERSWTERVLDGIQTINHVAEVLGLPQLPETSEQAFAGLASIYNLYVSELAEAAQIRGLRGEDTGDLRSFMLEIYRQKALYPSLAHEIDASLEVLGRSLPTLSDDRLLKLSANIRRTAFLLGESFEKTAERVGMVSRVTGRSGDDVAASFLTIRDFAVEAGNQAPGSVANIDNLIESFVNLSVSGYKYGISIEEAAYMTKTFKDELDRGIFTVDDLIQFATGLSNMGMEQRVFAGREIVNQLQGRPEYRELWNTLEPYVRAGDVYGMDRLIETIQSQAEDVGMSEFGIPPDMLAQLQQQWSGASREAVEEKAREFEVRNEIERDYVANALMSQILGADPSMTPDQFQQFREFRLRETRLRNAMDAADAEKVDDMMMAAEDVRIQLQEVVNVQLLNLGADIDVWIREHRDVLTATNLKDTVRRLREGALGLVGLKDSGDGGPAAAWSAVGGFVSPLDPSKVRITSLPSAMRKAYRNKAGTLIPAHRHGGVDIGVPSGTALYAMADGVVVELNRNWQSGGGIKIGILYDNGYSTRYLHMSKVVDGLKVGSRVQQGQLVGYSGGRDVGTPHLHLDVYKGGARKRGGTRIDPRQILPYFHYAPGRGDKVPARPYSGASAPASPKGSPKKDQQSSLRPFEVDVMVGAVYSEDMKPYVGTILESGLAGLGRLPETSSRQPFEIRGA